MHPSSRLSTRRLLALAVAISLVLTGGAVAVDAGSAVDRALAALASPRSAAIPSDAPETPEPAPLASGPATGVPADGASPSGEPGGLPPASQPPGEPTDDPATGAPLPSEPATGEGVLPATASPTVTPELDPPPAAGRFEIDLYEDGDFVSQANKNYCVPGAMLTMMNIMSEGAVDDPAIQDDLYSLARRLSTDRLEGPGAEPEGWADGLNELGFGPFVVDVQPSRAAAITEAARALRLTGRPVGLLVWRGAHSWVMSGFRSTADPAWSDEFAVTHVRIQDVWYPRVSSIWGPSRPPDALVPVDSLPDDYLAWRRPTGPYPEKDGGYVLVLPAEAPAGG